MGEFMQQQGDEEQGCRDQSSDPDLARVPTRVYLTKVFAEGERDQGSDNEPAVMKPDLYAGDCSEFDVGAHTRPSFKENHATLDNECSNPVIRILTIEEPGLLPAKHEPSLFRSYAITALRLPLFLAGPRRGFRSQ